MVTDSENSQFTVLLQKLYGIETSVTLSLANQNWTLNKENTLSIDLNNG